MSAKAPNTYAGTSPAAIEGHYDLPNEFWRLVLDPTMAYSCALFDSPEDTFEQAQINKLDWHAARARVEGCNRVLDVGCGWGGMARRLVEVHSVERVVGLTLSNSQHEWVSGFGIPNIDVRIENWADHEPEEPYDGIISVGAFEHFARADATRDGRVQAYRDFFKFCHGALRPGGWLSLQTMAKGNAHPTRESLQNTEFIWEMIFPESEVPWFSEIALATEHRFVVDEVRNDSAHYVKTADAWHSLLLERREEILDVVGVEIFDLYDRFLPILSSQFKTGHCELFRLALRRV